MNVFDNFPRTRTKRANHNSSQYEFLNTSAWKVAAYVRHIITEWTQDFPVDKDFVKRFTSKKDKEHRAAFFELTMFQWMKKQGLEIGFQHEATNDSNRRPDLTALQHGEIMFRAECTLSAMPDEIEGIETLKDIITDIIEAVPCPDFFIRVNFEKTSTQTLSKKKVEKFITQMIKEGSEGVLLNKKWTLDEMGWCIEFSLFKKSRPAQRSLGGISNGPASIIDSVTPLRRALNSKRGRNYGTQDKPYLICINSRDMYLDEISIAQTLFGIQYYSAWNLSESMSGFFLEQGIPQNQSVSAILITKDLGAYNLLQPQMAIWHNPWAHFQLPSNLLSISQNLFSKDESGRFNLMRIEGAAMGKILEINPEYLNSEIE